jgi:hypothetical protein
MSDETKNIVDAILALATLATAIAAGAWAYFRFSREGAHKERLELDLECSFLGPQNGVYVAAFSIYRTTKARSNINIRTSDFVCWASAGVTR